MWTLLYDILICKPQEIFTASVYIYMSTSVLKYQTPHNIKDFTVIIIIPHRYQYHKWWRTLIKIPTSTCQAITDQKGQNSHKMDKHCWQDLSPFYSLTSQRWDPPPSDQPSAQKQHQDGLYWSTAPKPKLTTIHGCIKTLVGNPHPTEKTTWQRQR